MAVFVIFAHFLMKKRQKKRVKSHRKNEKSRKKPTFFHKKRFLDIKNDKNKRSKKVRKVVKIRVFLKINLKFTRNM